MREKAVRNGIDAAKLLVSRGVYTSSGQSVARRVCL